MYLDSLQEVPLLLIVGVVQEFLNVGANAGNGDFRHCDLSPKEFGGSVAGWLKRKVGSGRGNSFVVGIRLAYR